MIQLLYVMMAMFLLFMGTILSQQPVNHVEKEQIVQEICSKLENHYVYPDIARRITDTLRHSLKKKKYDKAADNDAFAQLITRDLRSVNGDLHLRADPLTRRQKEPVAEPDWPEIFMNVIARNKAGNYGIVSVQILEGNIGYLELRKLAPMNSESRRILSGQWIFCPMPMG